MVIYVPVKFEFDWTNCFRLRVRQRKCGRTDGWTDKRTKNGRNYTNFERNLAMMVIYLPVKFEFDWTNRFRVRVRKRKCGRTDGWIDKRTKNGQNYTNFERNLAMMVIYLPVKFEFDWTNRFSVRVRKRKMWTDRQTDVWHINLIGGLVTRNPPKNQTCKLIFIEISSRKPKSLKIHWNGTSENSWFFCIQNKNQIFLLVTSSFSQGLPTIFLIKICSLVLE